MMFIMNILSQAEPGLCMCFPTIYEMYSKCKSVRSLLLALAIHLINYLLVKVLSEQDKLNECNILTLILYKVNITNKATNNVNVMSHSTETEY